MSSAQACARSPSQDGCRYPELIRRAPPVPVAVQRREVHVGRRPAAAGRGLVDHIVVYQREGVQQFQRGKQQQHTGIGVADCHGAPAPVGEGRPQPLAPAEHEIFEPGDQHAEVAAFGAT